MQARPVSRTKKWGATMKRSLALWATVLTLIVVTGSMASAQAQSQSLGDYARAAKKTKAPPSDKSTSRVYDNDNLPPAARISVVGDTSKSDQKDDATQEQDKAKA